MAKRKKIPAKKIVPIQLFVIRDGRKLFGMTINSTYEAAGATAAKLTKYLKTGIMCVADDEEGTYSKDLDPVSDIEDTDERPRCMHCQTPSNNINTEGMCDDCEAQMFSAPSESERCNTFVKGPSVHDSMVLMQCVLKGGHEGPCRGQ